MDTRPFQADLVAISSSASKCSSKCDKGHTAAQMFFPQGKYEKICCYKIPSHI